jgi:glycerol uptake facilitator protein
MYHWVRDVSASLLSAGKEALAGNGKRTIMAQTPELSRSQLNTPTLGQKCFAEFLGTAFLVFAGAGTATASGYLLGSGHRMGTADLVAIALAFGFALMVMVYAIGHISSCHINPAVTIAMAVDRRISWLEAVAYIIAQIIGGIVGAFIIAIAFPASAHTVGGFGATDFTSSGISYFAVIVLEAVGTFFLAFVIMATAVAKRARGGIAGLAIGLTLASVIFVLGPATGGSLNPARTIGPVVAQLVLGGSYPVSHVIAYIVGPIIGGIIGVYAYEYMLHVRVAERRGMRTPAVERP